jgi:signal transduction histidine kinase/HAMP domain-containing protein
MAAGRFGSWFGVAALAVWSGGPGPLPLLAATTGLLAALVKGPRTRLQALGTVTLLVGILAGFVAHRQVSEVSADWAGYWAARQASVEERLGESLERRLQGAEAAAGAAAAMAADSIPAAPAPLARIRRQNRVTALALYGPAGELLAWDGTHRGRVPEEVQRGQRRYAYGDLPLFGYLYVTAPTASGGTAVAAVLLRADLPGLLSSASGDFVAEFSREVGEPIRLVGRPAPGASPGWDWKLGDRTLFTVVLDPPAPEVRSAQIMAAWQVRVGAVVLVAWLLLAAGAPVRAVSGRVAAIVLVVMASVLPFHLLGGPMAALFGASGFVLPGPFPMTLGRLAVLVLAVVPLSALGARPPRVFPPLVGALLAGVAGALWLAWADAGPAAEALAEGRMAWVVYQGMLVCGLSLIIGTAMVLSRSPEPVFRRRAWLAGPLALVLAGGATFWVWGVGSIPAWWPVLWAAPVWAAVAWGAPWPGARGALALWGTAGVLAGTAGIPQAWSHRVDARMDVAAHRLARLAAPEDPELERALDRLGQAAIGLSAEGEAGVDLLFGAWRASGMADLAAPVWLTLWSPAGIPEEELRVGVVDRPVVSYEVQEDPGPGAGLRILRYDRDDARYVLRVTLSNDAILTAAAPPFTDPTFRAGLSPLLASRSAGGALPVTLIPLAAWEGSRGALVWARTSTGWQAESPLSFSNAHYVAHYAVPLPGVLLAAARGTLLLLADVILVFALRAAGLGLFRGAAAGDLRLSRFMISFRARVTLALFGFFVLAVAIFGTLAYRSIASASWRTAQVLAERVAEDAAGWYMEVSGRMQALSRRVGVELLEYRGGELRDGSVEELVHLGLYEGWVPMEAYRTLEERRDVRDADQSELGGWGYVSAFRRLPDGDILAAQVPRQAGATAIRSADVLELLAFAVLVGAALSLGLALLVARALTSPIHALQVASERVGAGNLALSLPTHRADEFGEVFEAFNRMVRGLRRTRRQLVRTTRRTKAIMEEAAVGMVALDAGGRVTLANPRAAGLLGPDIQVGQRLPDHGRLGEELVRWLEAFLRSDREEHGLELQDGPRRIRIRARRLGTDQVPGGAVMSVEDVTDELRTERVLAWGEMARQVAHEVKNPLTPMKLSVQHVRRAWEDKRGDFEAILFKNADAILLEIDRLAAIAKSFSRFGAPDSPGTVALEAVDVQRVVGEVMALYRGSEGPVSFEGLVPAGVPAAQARVTEMKEVLINLLENARVASPEGGVVRVEAAAEGTSGVLVQVSDTGRGIPEAIRARVFEPQFSTRSTGAGLGLAIVQRLVTSWGGSVDIETGAQGGTVVTLRLLAFAPPPETTG